MGIISPQQTVETNDFLSSIIEYKENVLTCAAPDFKNYINPIQLRRLSRMLRIGLSAATIAIRDADAPAVDGIITATGYGFLDETAKFLHEILEQQEKQLTPTYFMQSTYNALAGLVALSQKCTGYNNTYVSKGFSFENALHDCMMQLNDAPSHTFIVGAYDEASDVQYRANIRAGHYKHERVSNLRLFDSATAGALQGEGAAFFAIATKAESNCYAELVDVEILYRPQNLTTLSDAMLALLSRHSLSIDDINLVVDGSSGDFFQDNLLQQLYKSKLAGKSRVRFKHLCGEYCTATAFALWLSARILKEQRVPDAITVPDNIYRADLNCILVVNHYMGRNYSLTLLRKS